METNFAKRGVANAGLTTGIIGTALGVLNNMGGIFGTPAGSAVGCRENCDVNRYELGLEKSNAEKDAKISLLEANIYGDQKMLEMYKYVDGELKSIRTNLAAQDVKNAQIEGAFAVLGEQMKATKNEFLCALNRERDERCCGDNAIVNYVNATFYPKLVADVTVGTTTTAQTVYNPLPNCGCNH